jgi:AcrR family transcriptional regulator
MFRSGNQGASVRDICAAAGVPQGSFTNHFRSKEAFAQEVLGRYFANLKESVKKALDDKSLLVGKPHDRDTMQHLRNLIIVTASCDEHAPPSFSYTRAPLVANRIQFVPSMRAPAPRKIPRHNN